MTFSISGTLKGLVSSPTKITPPPSDNPSSGSSFSTENVVATRNSFVPLRESADPSAQAGRSIVYRKFSNRVAPMDFVHSRWQKDYFRRVKRQNGMGLFEYGSDNSLNDAGSDVDDIQELRNPNEANKKHSISSNNSSTSVHGKKKERKDEFKQYLGFIPNSLIATMYLQATASASKNKSGANSYFNSSTDEQNDEFLNPISYTGSIQFLDVAGFSKQSNIFVSLEEAVNSTSTPTFDPRTMMAQTNKENSRRRLSLTKTKVTGASGELLFKRINKSFQKLIPIINAYGGDVLKFAGDALIVSYNWKSICSSASAKESVEELKRQVLMSVLCSLEIAQIAESGECQGIHIGIALGQVISMCTGGVQDRWEYILAGKPFEQIGRVLELASLNQVVVTAEIWRMLESLGNIKLEGQMLENKDILLGSCRVLNEQALGISIPNTKESSYNCEDRIKWIQQLFSSLYSTSINSTSVLNDGNEMLCTTSIDHEQPWEKIKRKIIQHAKTLIPEPYLNLNASVATTMDMSTISELLNVTVLFIKITGIDFSIDYESPAKLQKVVEYIQIAIYDNEGYIRQVCVDDKGIVAIGYFSCSSLAIGASFLIEAGLYNLNRLLWDIWGEEQMENYVNGVESSSTFDIKKGDDDRNKASSISSTQSLLHQPLLAAMGLASGACYCGIVGGFDQRCEYAIVGDGVVLAARLMGYGSKSLKSIQSDYFERITNGRLVYLPITCDEKTKDEAAQNFSFENLGKIKIKGKEEEITVFRPFLQNLQTTSMLDSGPQPTKLIGRERELKVILNELKSKIAFVKSQYSNDITKMMELSSMNRPSVFIVTGDGGMGKSRFLKEILLFKDPLTVFLCTTERNFHDKYLSIWKQIMEKIILHDSTVHAVKASRRFSSELGINYRSMDVLKEIAQNDNNSLHSSSFVFMDYIEEELEKLAANQVLDSKTDHELRDVASFQFTSNETSKKLNSPSIDPRRRSSLTSPLFEKMEVKETITQMNSTNALKAQVRKTYNAGDGKKKKLNLKLPKSKSLRDTNTRSNSISSTISSNSTSNSSSSVPEDSKLNEFDTPLSKLRSNPRIQSWLPILQLVLPQEFQDEMGLDSNIKYPSCVLNSKYLGKLIITLLKKFIDLSKKPLVLLIDDVHTCDDFSWQVLLELLDSSIPIVFVLGYRTAIGESEESRRSNEYRKNLLVNYRAVEFKLVPFTNTDLNQYLSDLLGMALPHVPDSILESLLEFSRGNPYVLKETINYLIHKEKENFLKIENGQISFNENVKIENCLPSSVRDMISTTLDRLSVEEQLLVKFASAIGRSFRLDLLQEIFPMSQDRFQIVIRSLMEQKIFGVICGDGKGSERNLKLKKVNDTQDTTLNAEDMIARRGSISKLKRQSVVKSQNDQRRKSYLRKKLREAVNKVMKDIHEKNDDTKQGLTSLVSQVLIQKVSKENLPHSLSFVLIPMQQDAYSRIPLSMRKEYHRLIALALEKIYGDRVAMISGTLAHHWGAAEDPTKELLYLELLGYTCLRSVVFTEAIKVFDYLLKDHQDRASSVGSDLTKIKDVKITQFKKAEWSYAQACAYYGTFKFQETTKCLESSLVMVCPSFSLSMFNKSSLVVTIHALFERINTRFLSKSKGFFNSNIALFNRKQRKEYNEKILTARICMKHGELEHMKRVFSINNGIQTYHIGLKVVSWFMRAAVACEAAPGISTALAESYSSLAWTLHCRGQHKLADMFYSTSIHIAQVMYEPFLMTELRLQRATHFICQGKIKAAGQLLNEAYIATKNIGDFALESRCNGKIYEIGFLFGYMSINASELIYHTHHMKKDIDALTLIRAARMLCYQDDSYTAMLLINRAVISMREGISLETEYGVQWSKIKRPAVSSLLERINVTNVEDWTSLLSSGYFTGGALDLYTCAIAAFVCSKLYNSEGVQTYLMNALKVSKYVNPTNTTLLVIYSSFALITETILVILGDSAWNEKRDAIFINGTNDLELFTRRFKDFVHAVFPIGRSRYLLCRAATKWMLKNTLGAKYDCEMSLKLAKKNSLFMDEAWCLFFYKTLDPENANKYDICYKAKILQGMRQGVPGAEIINEYEKEL